ncbi:hypothetical protein ABI59_04795 [Acidobacteria bacterium Mor1]|nr:hypothetical protein ABI59_04795 [Acidobacteria bacterium Mor1]
MAIRLAACATHPIQVQVPLFRCLARQPDIDLHVFYANDDNVRPTYSPQFGVTMAWDVPLLEGYPYTVLGNRATMSNSAAEPGLLRRMLVFNAPEIRDRLREARFDALLVPGYARLFYLQAMEGARRSGTAILFRGNNRDETGDPRPLLKRTARRLALRRVYGRIDAFLSIGKYMRRHFHEFGVDDSRIFDTPYCIDDALFEDQRARFLPQRDTIREELGIPPEALVLLYSGKISSQKAPLLLAEALEILGPCPDLHLIVMGDGPLRGELEQAARPLLGPRLHMLGFVNQSAVGRYHAASDCLVLCSDRGESWGLVVNEAMTFGRPALVSDGVGCRDDLVQHGRTGFVFPRGDAGKLAGHLRDLLTDRGLAARMGREARELIAGYSVERNVEGIRAALESVTGQKRHWRAPARTPGTSPRSRSGRASSRRPEAAP